MAPENNSIKMILTFSTWWRSQVYKSFMTLLEQSEIQAKKRIVMGEAIEDSIAKVLKDFYKLKASLTKKNIEFGAKYQQEIWNACDELERTRALYDKAAKDADAAHKKFQDSLFKPKGLSALKNIVTGKDAASVSEQVGSLPVNQSRSDLIHVSFLS